MRWRLAAACGEEAADETPGTQALSDMPDDNFAGQNTVAPPATAGAGGAAAVVPMPADAGIGVPVTPPTAGAGGGNNPPGTGGSPTMPLPGAGGSNTVAPPAEPPVAPPEEPPTPAQGLFSQIDVGDDITCAIVNGRVFCTGDVDAPDSSSILARIPGATGETFVKVSAGVNAVCALTESGRIFCVGENIDQLGLGEDAPSEITSWAEVTPPVGVVFSDLSAAEFHGCGLSTTGGACCWGYNESQAVGVPLTEDALEVPSPTMVSLPEGLTLTQVDVGFSASCGISTAQDLYCWGDAQATAQSAEIYPDGVLPAAQVPGLDNVTDVSVGTNHACAVTGAGQVYCWGENRNLALGVPDKKAGNVPVDVHFLAARPP